MMLVETQRKTITVGIVEPQEATQYAISMLLNGQQDSEVIGVEATGEDGMRMLIEKRPKIAIVEVDLEGRSGFELAGDLAMRQGETKVIFYSSAMPDIYIEQALRSKASGYVLKTDALASLLTAVQAVSKGGTFYSEPIRDRISIDPSTGSTRAQFESRMTQLSNRQLEVLRHLAYGHSVKDVARKMHISVKSVDSHKYRIMQSLGIHDRVDLARYAIREGLVCA
jgi:DNA-binding NarL/FixJ family response regulator